MTFTKSHRRLFKLVPFESLGAVSYLPSIVTMALSCIISDIKVLVENCDFFIPLTFDAPLGESPSEYCHPVWYGKTRIVGLPDSEKTLMCIIVQTECRRMTDRQTADGQTDIYLAAA